MVTPDQKMQIIAGDGVIDVPALKATNINIVAVM
jgi:hypothetical protein